MHRDDVVRYIAAMSDTEYADLTAEARADTTPTPEKLLRAAQDSGDVAATIRAKTAQLFPNHPK